MPPVLAPRTSLADIVRWAIKAFPVRDALFLVAFAAIYAATCIYGNRIPSPAPIWLPDAVLVSVLLLTHSRRWVGLIAAVVVIRLLPPLAPGVPFALLLLFLLGDLLKAFLAVFLLRRFDRHALRFDSMRAIGIYIACAVVAAPAVSAFIGAAGRAALGEHYWSAWIVWFLGDALACLLIAPAILLWIPHLRSLNRDTLPGQRTVIEAVALAAALLIVGIIIFIGSSSAGLHSVSQLYLITPLLLWAAVRFGPIGISAALACVALLAITGAATGGGPFVIRATSMNTIALQIFLAITAVPLLLLAAAIAERTHAKQDVEALASRLLRTRDEERRRIARELHDSTLQTVTAVKLDLHRLRVRLKRAEYDEAMYSPLLDESDALTDQVIIDLRTLSYLLHPPMLEELGLAAALQWYVEGIAQRSNLHIELQTPDESQRFPRQVEVALYRVAQEGLAYVYHPSRGSSTRITLSKLGSVLYLRLQDQRTGIAAGMAGGGGAGAGEADAVAVGASEAREGPMGHPLVGVGITSMRRRVQQLGGRLEISSSAYGTLITAIVPLDGKPAYDETQDGGLIGDELESP